ncbi:NADP-dependent oxidoreductase [Moritella sp.]|uniref:NADP-dependent oxidoreductase n=1 Tax=Moritella sp. TaxID=78556 RepID=UPI001DA5A204|nr:NADP-dependent oxidoreductase [Moritella sp.]MCJ8349192.1 NADP-dependent oxidoreductase [Moritella sp.]NQZ39480.1 NADP-dependent oxidoreductase [Moritella sp.]
MKTNPLMKAVRIHEYGGQHTLRTEQITLPEITADEVLIEVVNTSVNPVDWKVREGWLADEDLHQLPLTLGWDIAGRISQVGENINNFKVGDEVYSFSDLTRDGAYAEFVAVDASAVSYKPKNISFAQAAAVPLTSLTAWQAIYEVSQLSAGDSVLIHGASGGVGSFAVQFAKQLGAKVTAVASAANHDYLRELGADNVVDYKTPNYLTTLATFDVVFDIVDNDVAGIYDKVNAKGKYIATLKEHDIPEQFTFEHARVMVMPNGEHLTKIGALIDNNEIQVPAISEMPFDQIAQAHALSETEHVRGKIVINI